MVLQSVFEHGKMVRGEGLLVLEEKMKTMDPDENEIYKRRTGGLYEDEKPV